ncbi:hypothetical protein NMY22_g6599 [Coprinellus aureogranulatus]|nr:hypothetical protein NMY22_g6599 [Coprinellus aureogranulatus]
MLPLKFYSNSTQDPDTLERAEPSTHDQGHRSQHSAVASFEDTPEIQTIPSAPIAARGVDQRYKLTGRPLRRASPSPFPLHLYPYPARGASQRRPQDGSREGKGKEGPRYGTTQSHEVLSPTPTRPTALTLGPRKKPNLQTDPLVHHGRHFGRTVYAFANMHALIVAGLAADEESPPETQQERRELRVFQKLLSLIPGFEERLVSCKSEEEVMAIASMLQKGAASARSDDTKSLKGAVVDWVERQGEQRIEPPISRNMKQKRGFEHERTGFLLCPPQLDWNDPEVKAQLRTKELTISGSDWPIFLYKDEKYDSEHPWRGLFRNEILVKGFKHIFTSPSSVDDEPKATRSGNARIHGMCFVTPASLAYVFTQIRFSLTSASVFSRTDRETDSETFYNSVLELLEDPEEQDEVKPLMSWWNQSVYLQFFRKSSQQRSIFMETQANLSILLDLSPSGARQ